MNSGKVNLKFIFNPFGFYCSTSEALRSIGSDGNFSVLACGIGTTAYSITGRPETQATLQRQG